MTVLCSMKVAYKLCCVLHVLVFIKNVLNSLDVNAFSHKDYKIIISNLNCNSSFVGNITVNKNK